jgi:hypothetical protein
MSKAVELPINVMVIIVIAVIILLALVAMYFTGFSPFSTAVGLEGVRGDACRRLVQENGCRVETNEIEINGFDANKDNLMGAAETGSGWDWETSVCGDASNGDNLASFCACYYSLSSENACKSLCGCAGGGFSSGGGSAPVSCIFCTAWVDGACGGDGCTATERQQTRNYGVPAGCNSCPDGLGLSRCIPDATCNLGPLPCTSCTAWVDGACGGDGCTATERQQTRNYGVPAGCNSCPDGLGLSRCRSDATCTVACSWRDFSCGTNPNQCCGRDYSPFPCGDGSGTWQYVKVCGPPGCTGTCGGFPQGSPGCDGVC